jgi:hypothetical protein
LLAGIAISVVSGWGITRTEIIYNASAGLIDRGVANAIHRATQVPLVTIFLTHVLTAIRARVWERSPGRKVPLDIVLAVIGLAVLAITVYMETA